MVSAHPAPRCPVYFPPEGHEKTDTPNHLAFFSIFGGFGVPNRPPGEGPRTTSSHLFPLRPPLGSPKGPWATKTDPRDAKTTPRRSQKAGLWTQKCQKSIQKPRKPCNKHKLREFPLGGPRPELGFPTAPGTVADMPKATIYIVPWRGHFLKMSCPRREDGHSH